MSPAGLAFDDLRVLDLGTVGALRSQTLWHAVAHGVSDGSPPTLLFLRPAQPYVGIGFHRRLQELDLETCRTRGLPVYRRMVGGGPVYLDDGQLFFAVVVPATAVPASRLRAIETLLAPAVDAYRAAGLAAAFDENGEIVVGDRKVCGHGAGQIGGAVIVVGNLIQRFDHRAASEVLAAPTAPARMEVQRLMTRYVAAHDVDSDRFQTAAIDAYAATFGARCRPGALGSGERAHLAELDRRFVDPAWVDGPPRPEPALWQVKIRAGVRVFSVVHDGARITGSLVGDHLEWISVDGADARDPAVERSLVEAALAACERSPL